MEYFVANLDTLDYSVAMHWRGTFQQTPTKHNTLCVDKTLINYHL